MTEQLTPDERKAMKGLGILSNRDKQHFTLRILTGGNGVLTTEELAKISEAAKRFGDGRVALTTRLTVEVQNIPYENVAPLRAFLDNAGIQYGGTGARIRPIAACKGTVCVYGLIDTQALGRELHHRFYDGWHDIVLPHKFKIAVGGCANNCMKPDLNDFGVSGRMVKGERGYRIYLGGRWGKSTRHGTLMECFLTKPEEVYEMLERTLLFFRENAYQGERFGLMMDRIGAEETEHGILSATLLARKQAILTAPLLQKPQA